MKSRTSFFNLTVLRKNLTRFAPLWALTAVFEVLCLLTVGMAEPLNVADLILVIMNGMAIPSMIYAVCVAACVFGDLFNNRLCNGLHAMPMRRDGWLLTNLASGFLFALIPSVVGGAVAAAILKDLYWAALLWQGIILLQFVFFFGAAVFSAVCAGKRSGMMAIYVLINFLSVLIYWIADTFYEPLLPGVVLPSKAFTIFSPVVNMTGTEYVQYDYKKGPILSWETINTQDWNYLLICAGVGVVLLVLSWLLYRKRHLETAGDFISFRPVKMVFLLAYTFAVGTFFHSVFGAFDDGASYGFLIVGVLIGWFTGWMLLERTVKVFTKKVILGFVAFGLLFSGSVALTASDPMKIAVSVPNAKDIESACLYTQSKYSYYNYDWYAGGWYRTEEDEIAQVQQLHRQMITMPEEENTETVTAYIHYRLKNGKEIQRAYEIPAGSQTAQDLGNHLSNIKAVLNTNDDWQTIQENVQRVEVHWEDFREKMVTSSQEVQMDTVLAALEADCLAGAMAQDGNLHHDAYAGYMEITWEDQQYGKRTEYLDIYEDCVHLYEFIKAI